jgi:hypothetical protein
VNQDNSDSVKERVKSLLAPLPLRFVHDVLRQVGRLSFSGPADRLEMVKHTFVEYLNNRRPNRSRRLFTDLFTPVLISDSVLLRAKRPIPGVIQRVDAAGLWDALARYAFPDLVIKVQRALDELATNQLLDDVFKSPEASALKERMRIEAVRYLRQLLTDDRHLPGFLDVLNRKRLAEGRKVALYLDTIAPMDRGFIQFVHDFLVLSEECDAYLRGLTVAPTTTAWSELEAERAAEKLVAAVEDMRETLALPGIRSELPLLAPLATLSVSQQYGAVALYIRETGISNGHSGYVIEALIGHFSACCTTLCEVLNRALKLDERLAGASIKVTGREMTELDGALRRLTQLMPAMIVGGIMENRHTEPAFRFIWQDLARFISERLLMIANQRANVLIMARQMPALDHKDVLWLIRLIWNWHQLARTYDQSLPVFEKWREHLIEDLRLAVEKASRVEEGDALIDRMAHLLRLNDLGRIFGYRIAPLLSVSSQNIGRMMALWLEGHPEMPADDRALIGDYMGMVRFEMARSRNWRSPELMDLLKLAEAQGL